MKDSKGTTRAVRLLAGVLSGGMLLSGCAGPSTRILPRENTGQVYERPEESLVLEEVNPFYLQEELDILTASSRPSGSRGESDAARYMQQLLQDYGYETDRQRFRYESGENVVTGTNVVAVRKAPFPDADILIVSTHHDTCEGSPGANNNASGVVTLLETARLLSRLPTDTEVRFLSFSGHEANRLGARHYMDSLTKRERERMIGAVDLNTLGYISDDRIVLGTLDGKATMLGDMLNEASQDVLGESWGYEERQTGAVGTYVAEEIPAVAITQGMEPFEDGTPLDTAVTVDIERVSHVVDVVSQMISQVMSTDTPSMTAKAHFYNDLRDYAFVQKKKPRICFGTDRETAELAIGIRGFLAATNTDEAGREILKYQYPMKWFGVDQIILTNYYYTDGKLDTISLDADKAGVDFEDMKERLTDVYGEPVGESNGPSGTEYGWTDPVYRSYFDLIPGSDGYRVEIREYSTDKTVLEQRTPDGAILLQNLEDKRTDQVMELFHKIFPQEAWGRIGAVTLYTDGVGETTGYIEPFETAGEAGQAAAPGGENALWELGIDIEDLLDEDGVWRNETEAVRTLVRLYGQLLEASMQGQYIEAFETRFNGAPDQPGQEDQPEGTEPQAGTDQPEGTDQQAPEPFEKAEVRPGVGPGDSTEEDLIPPDFAEAFQLFVLAQKPESMTGNWSGRVGFFYGYEELTAYRSLVRKNLQLQAGVENADE